MHLRSHLPVWADGQVRYNGERVTRRLSFRHRRGRRWVVQQQNGFVSPKVGAVGSRDSTSSSPPGGTCNSFEGIQRATRWMNGRINQSDSIDVGRVKIWMVEASDDGKKLRSAVEGRSSVLTSSFIGRRLGNFWCLVWLLLEQNNWKEPKWWARSSFVSFCFKKKRKRGIRLCPFDRHGTTCSAVSWAHSLNEGNKLKLHDSECNCGNATFFLDRPHSFPYQIWIFLNFNNFFWILNLINLIFRNFIILTSKLLRQFLGIFKI